MPVYWGPEGAHHQTESPSHSAHFCNIEVRYTSFMAMASERYRSEANNIRSISPHWESWISVSVHRKGILMWTEECSRVRFMKLDLDKCDETMVVVIGKRYWSYRTHHNQPSYQNDCKYDCCWNHYKNLSGLGWKCLKKICFSSDSVSRTFDFCKICKSRVSHCPLVIFGTPVSYSFIIMFWLLVFHYLEP